MIKLVIVAIMWDELWLAEKFKSNYQIASFVEKILKYCPLPRGYDIEIPPLKKGVQKKLSIIIKPI